MWTQTPARTLVVACSDGRIWRDLDAHVAINLGASTYDRLSLPGGPAALLRDYGAHRAAVAREALSFLITQHRIAHLICVFHGAAEGGPDDAQCGDYARRSESASVAQQRHAEQIARAFQGSANVRLTILFAEVGRAGLVFVTKWAGSRAVADGAA